MGDDVTAFKACIAIVEDDKDLVLMYEKIFKSRGLAICFVAYDGYEAVKKFVGCEPKPPIILLDNRLLTTNGVETTKKILKIAPRTKIIFLSAEIDAEKDAMDAGAFEFLKKPASMYEIVDAIKKACKMIA